MKGGVPDRMVADTIAQLGGLHIAVNNAGINRSSAAEHTPEEDWVDTLAVNTTGVFLCCQVTSNPAQWEHCQSAACTA